MSNVIAVLFIGSIYTLLALPHLVVLSFCRRVSERSLPIHLRVASYGGALSISAAIVMRVSAGAPVSELAAFFVPFSIVILAWWATIFFPIRRARGLSHGAVLVIPAVFVPTVFVCTFFCTFPTDKWRVGNFTDRVQMELQAASAYLWPSWLIAALGIVIYTWTPFARRRSEGLQLEPQPYSDVGEDDGVATERTPNPYSPPLSL